MVQLGKYISMAICISALLIIVGVNKSQTIISTIGICIMAIALVAGYINMRVVSKKLDKESYDEAVQMGIIKGK